METFYAPAQRLDRQDLTPDIRVVSVNPIIKAMLNTVSGMLAVLNEHRQILALNDAFLKLLGIHDAENALGLRPGEALQCIYRDAHEGGCGTSAYCATCGAAIAMVTCLATDRPSEKECAMTVDLDGSTRDLFLKVRACPIAVDDRRFILLFVQDITHQQQWEALGRVFFHDLSNIIYGLVGNSEILLNEATHPNRDIVERIHRLSLRLSREVQMQKHLTQMADADYHPDAQPITVDQIFNELKIAFESHPAAKNRQIDFSDKHRKIVFKSDFFLVVRVLTNMVVNALEATTKGKAIKIWAAPEDAGLSFFVWNHQMIAPEVIDRVFQRNISTKAYSGRGLGTYSIKLFGEAFLNGKVGFTSSETEGTTFRLQLPLSL
ncbi:two component system sensor histidine kinase [Desulfosarcina variabilis str. Montpellier]|uniref:ATP-binding protein n=1 Tax=Desulfosarcina variabilis TaxID=2300 RepID=UPI003AFAB505